jgi:hypothetical protein
VIFILERDCDKYQIIFIVILHIYLFIIKFYYWEFWGSFISDDFFGAFETKFHSVFRKNFPPKIIILKIS